MNFPKLEFDKEIFFYENKKGNIYIGHAYSTKVHFYLIDERFFELIFKYKSARFMTIRENNAYIIRRSLLHDSLKGVIIFKNIEEFKDHFVEYAIWTWLSIKTKRF